MKIDKDMFSLKGKTSVVTGAARGNGKEIATSFAKNGANVILIDKLLPELKKLKKDLKKYKVTVKFFLCDLSSLDDKSHKKNLTVTLYFFYVICHL